MQKNCCIVFVKLQVEHAGQKRPKYNVGEPIYLYGMELCSLCRNPYEDDIVFSYQTSNVFGSALIARKWETACQLVFKKR